MHMAVVRVPLVVVAHVATLVDMDVGVTTSAVRMIVYVLDCSASLFREPPAGCASLVERTPAVCLCRRVLLRVATVIETDVGVASRAVCVVYPGLPDYQEMLIRVHSLR